MTDYPKELRDTFYSMGSHEALDYVYENADMLRENGYLERCVVVAYTEANMRLSAGITWEVIGELLSKCDREKLKQAGHKPRNRAPFKVFRGVASTNAECGFSWTSSFAVACLFAKANRDFGYGDELIIFSGIMSDSDFYFYTNIRKESEFVGLPSQITRLDVTPEEVLVRAQQQQEKLK